MPFKDADGKELWVTVGGNLVISYPEDYDYCFILPNDPSLVGDLVDMILDATDCYIDWGGEIKSRIELGDNE